MHLVGRGPGSKRWESNAALSLMSLAVHHLPAHVSTLPSDISTQIADLAVQDLTPTEIAKRLGISVSFVEVVMNSLLFQTRIKHMKAERE